MEKSEIIINIASYKKAFSVIYDEGAQYVFVYK
jgi:hypothetical protein